MYYVALDVKNHVREDITIYWLQLGGLRQRICPSLGRCAVAFKLKHTHGRVPLFEFKALTRETNIRLLMNNSRSIHIRPTHYQNIVDTIVDYAGKFALPIIKRFSFIIE